MDHPDNRSSSNPEKKFGHETTDIRPMAIGFFALGLIAMLGLVLPALIWMYREFEAAARSADPVRSVLTDNQVPPAPRLQVNPTADLDQLRKEENQQLSTYGWVDSEKNVVRVPIDHAMKILAERGLPESEAQSALAPKQE